ncbi:hypothetical protein LTR08_001286 [Meristemomyces frigidus]|nr:hypothetical protein LTR08_001286 [Meristemomyces frigidus]
MSIDLSDVPPMIQPSPPTNTLLITNLQDPTIFTGSNLSSIQTAIAAHAPLHTFAPLKSMRRIICSFWTIEDATEVRKVLDGETVLGARVRVYFGAMTKVDEAEEERYLKTPASGKLFFISPPPSPPMGWEMRDEAPPNKEVHADDLAEALAKLHAKPAADEALRDHPGDASSSSRNLGVNAGGKIARPRSGTGTVLFDPQDHAGYSPVVLPAISLEDTSASPEDDDAMEGVETGETRFPHTARPPVELMES